jgi:hypothetical protein
VRLWWCRLLAVVMLSGMAVGTAGGANAVTAPAVPVVTATLTGQGTVTRAEVSPLSGRMKAVSCTDDFCLAADERGHYVTFDGTSWTAPRVFDEAEMTPASPYLEYAKPVSVSCASATFCMIVDSSPTAFVFDGVNVVRAPTTDMHNATLASCPEPGTCFVAGGTKTMRYDQGDWSEVEGWVVDGSGAGDRFACGSRTYCVASDGGRVASFDGETWSNATSLAVDDAIVGVDCPSALTCLAMAGTGEFAYADGAWSRIGDSPFPIGAGSSLTCSAVGACVDRTASGGLVMQKDGVWSGLQLPEDLVRGQVTCGHGGTCVATDAVGQASWLTTTGWHGAVMVDPTGGDLTAMDCASARRCVAVGDSGQFARMNGGVWEAPTVADPTSSLKDVSCPTADFCLAVGYDGLGIADENAGRAVAIRGSSWELIPVPVALTHLSCATATYCVGSNSKSFWAWRGGVWAQVAAPTGSVGWWMTYDISCASVSLCMVGSQIFDGRTWRQAAGWPTVASKFPPAVDCWAASACTALTARTDTKTPALTTFNGRTWSDPTPLDSIPLASGGSMVNWGSATFTCASTVCAVAPAEYGVVFVGRSVVASVEHSAAFGRLSVVDAVCPDATQCRFLTATGVTTWVNPSPPSSGVRQVAPRFLSPLRSKVAKVGSKVTWRARVDGTPIPQVRWEISRDRGKSWKRLRAGLSLTVKVTKNSGRLRYRAVASNVGGTSITRAVKVTPRRR